MQIPVSAVDWEVYAVLIVTQNAVGLIDMTKSVAFEIYQYGSYECFVERSGYYKWENCTYPLGYWISDWMGAVKPTHGNLSRRKGYHIE